MFEKAKQRREAQHEKAVDRVKQMREDGYYFQMQPVMTGSILGNRFVEEVIFGDEGCTRVVAEAIGMNLGKHGGIVGNPEDIAVRLGALIADLPDGLLKVFDEIRTQAESWREAGYDDDTIRVGLIRSDLLQPHNLQVDKVMAMLRTGEYPQDISAF